MLKFRIVYGFGQNPQHFFVLICSIYCDSFREMKICSVGISKVLLAHSMYITFS